MLVGQDQWVWSWLEMENRKIKTEDKRRLIREKIFENK